MRGKRQDVYSVPRTRQSLKRSLLGISHLSLCVLLRPHATPRCAAHYENKRSVRRVVTCSSLRFLRSAAFHYCRVSTSRWQRVFEPRLHGQIWTVTPLLLVAFFFNFFFIDSHSESLNAGFHPTPTGSLECLHA